jgi:hypothetical protein
MRYVMVHSPVLGPSSWQWVADSLRSRGHEVAVPDLMTAALTGDPAAYAQAAAQVDHDGECVVVGHSGAGSVLPTVAALMNGTHRMVFIDAALPPREGEHTAGGDFLDALHQLAIDGVLPPWSQWFGPDVMKTLVPDDERRGVIESELPTVPLAFFQEPITLPPRWCTENGSYVLLSEAYRGDAEKATSLGWPVIERIGGHLDIANNEESIADILSRLT